MLVMDAWFKQAPKKKPKRRVRPGSIKWWKLSKSKFEEEAKRFTERVLKELVPIHGPDSAEMILEKMKAAVTRVGQKELVTSSGVKM